MHVPLTTLTAFLALAGVSPSGIGAWQPAPAPAPADPEVSTPSPSAAPEAPASSTVTPTLPSSPGAAPTSVPVPDPGDPARTQAPSPEPSAATDELRRELEVLRAELAEIKRAIGPKKTPGPGEAVHPDPVAPGPVSQAPAAVPPAPQGAAVEGAPSAWAATPSARGPFTCLSRRCKQKRKALVVPTISARVGRGVLSLNLYGDFGYAFGPQGKHKYYDYITKQEVEDHGRRDFTSYPLYANQFAMAYGFVQGQYEIPNKLRFRFALHAGHIVESLYNEEPKSLQMIREAAIYYFFHPKLAVEAGILPSYYGAEIVLNKENLHATRAYIADFTPDYEAGLRLHYHFRKDMALRFMVLNGWQEIRDANGRKGYGFVWSVFKPFKIVGDWTMYWGNEAPRGEPPIFRHYQNLYYRIWLGKRWLIFPMFDFVMQKNNEKDRYDVVVSPAFSVRLALTEKVGLAARYEYLYNKADIVPELRTGSPNGWQSHSGAATLEYLPLPQLTFRVEGRYGVNKDAVFRDRANMPVKDDWYVYLGGAFHF